MALDEKEQQILENQEISQSRAKTFRYWLDTSAVLLLVVFLLSGIYILWFVGVPTLNSIKDSSDAAATGWKDTVNEAGQEIIEGARKLNSTMTHVEAIAKNGADISTDAKQLVHDSAAELPKAIQGVTAISEAGRGAIEKVGREAGFMIMDSNRRLNGEGGLMMAMTATVTDFQKVEANASLVITQLAGKSDQAFDDLHNIMAAPEWVQARGAVMAFLKKANSTMGHVDGVSA